VGAFRRISLPGACASASSEHRGVASPQALADLGVVEFEPPQDAAALQCPDDVLRQAQALANRPCVHRRHDA
jgi:hypothetical protein